MSWVSNVGRKFLQAYSEGLAMSCPLHRAGDMDPTGAIQTSVMPAAIDRLQGDVNAALRPEFARGQTAPAGSVVHH